MMKPLNLIFIWHSLTGAVHLRMKRRSYQIMTHLLIMKKRIRNMQLNADAKLGSLRDMDEFQQLMAKVEEAENG